MGKKMKLPFLSKSKTPSEEIRSSSSSSSSSWPWPSCTQPRTLSFRVGNDIFKTLNSTYFDPKTTTETTTELVEPPDSSFYTTSSDHSRPSFSTASDDSGGESIETVIRGLRSERLFFEPKAGETSSIVLEEETDNKEDDRKHEIIPFKESVALSMDSPDPIVDFRKSMEEMVEAHGLKDWEHLEELLCWYLRVNGKSNHGYIVGAFVDLLVGLAFSTTSNANATNCSCDMINSPSSPLFFYNSTSSTSSSSSSSSTPCTSSKEESESTTVCLSSLLEGEEDEISEEADDGASS